MCASIFQQGSKLRFNLGQATAIVTTKDSGNYIRDEPDISTPLLLLESQVEGLTANSGLLLMNLN